MRNQLIAVVQVGTIETLRRLVCKTADPDAPFIGVVLPVRGAIKPVWRWPIDGELQKELGL